MPTTYDDLPHELHGPGTIAFHEYTATLYSTRSVVDQLGRVPSILLTKTTIFAHWSVV